MKDVNKVILLGRLGANPIRRYTKSGTPVVHFPVATKRRLGKGTMAQLHQPDHALNTGISESSEFSDSNLPPMSMDIKEESVAQSSNAPHSSDETQWHQIVSWGKLAENCAQYLRKGNSVYVEGSLRSHTYNDKAGAQKWALEVHAETISFLGGP